MTDEGKTTLGGREFRPLLQSTLEHDFWVLSQIRKHRLDTITLGPGEDAEAFARRLLGQVISSGAAFDLLGGLLIPAELGDVAWSPQTAAETSNHLRTVMDPGEKSQVQAYLASLLIGFFQSGLVSATISENYSEASPGSQDRAGVTSTSVSGPRQYFESQTVILNGLQGSPGGTSGTSARDSSR